MSFAGPPDSSSSRPLVNLLLLVVAAVTAAASCDPGGKKPRGRQTGGSGGAGGDQTGGTPGFGGSGTGGSGFGGSGANPGAGGSGGSPGRGGTGGGSGAGGGGGVAGNAGGAGSGGRADGAAGGGGTDGSVARDGGGSSSDGSSSSSCGIPRLPAGNRCGGVAQVTRGQGNDPLIDDFEPSPTDTATCRLIRNADGRQGAWTFSKDSATPNTVTRTLEPPGPGGAPGSTRALKFAGTGVVDRASLTVALAPCYDASKYRGLSFWFKGNPAGAQYVKVWFTTAATIVADSGGACVPTADEECRDHFTVHLLRVSDVWTKFAFTWKQLAQMGFGKLAGGAYQPQTEILNITFAPQWDDAVPAPMGRSFELWLDDLSLDPGGGYAASGFTSIITKARFDAAFASKRAGALAPLFANAYADLAAALDLPEFSRIGREGSLDDRKREIAAFMAHVVQETGSLQHTTELAPPTRYCDATYTQYPCASGQSYMGRGPLQLSWNYNYGNASKFFDLGNQYLTNPGAVIANGATAWKVAAFTWQAWKDPSRNTLKFGSHARFLEEGFGATIRAINGALECPNAPAANNRRANYQAFCSMLGVGGCDRNLACPPS